MLLAFATQSTTDFHQRFESYKTVVEGQDGSGRQEAANGIEIANHSGVRVLAIDESKLNGRGNAGGRQVRRTGFKGLYLVDVGSGYL